MAIILLFSCRASAQPQIEALTAGLPEKVHDALARIDGDGRRLLALRSYLRSARSLDSRWSWTRAEIEAYEGSEAHGQALRAIEKVTAAFEERNPGFTLRVNNNVRSLDEQIANWNRNASVASGAAEIAAAVSYWFSEQPRASEREFRAFLSAWKPSGAVFIAAPGLSPHGRAQAFDFQIARAGAVIAAANTRIIDSVWDADGWTERLKDAVSASGEPFEGPLENPREPWHYEYNPVRP
ncbi:MAG: hypothetical protein AB7I79_23875 [Rhizobiaceae bacterium]